MAICGRCGRRTESAGEVCPNCSEYASATSPAGAYAQSEFAKLPHFERPFAGRGTVWPTDPLLAPSPPSDGYAGPDEHANPEQDQAEHAHPEEDHAEQGSLEQSDSQLGDLLDPRPLTDDPESDAADSSAQSTEPATLPRGGRWIALTAANAVLLLAVAGAVMLVLRHERASQTARIDRPSAAARPSRSTLASAPLADGQLVVYPAAATAPDEAAIAASLRRYFDAINNHEYLVYKRSFVVAQRGAISASSFSTEFSTTTDSSEQLHSINVIGAGRVDALVTFVSQQPTVDRPGSPTCTGWSMEFSLGRRGTRYLLVAPPQWYEVSTTTCA